MKKPRLPTVSKRKNPSGKIAFRINYFDPWEERRIQVVVGTRKVDAQKLAQHVFEEMMARFHGEQAPETKEITLQELIEIFFQTKENRITASSIRRYRTLSKNFLDFMKANFPSIKTVSMVKRSYIEEFLQFLSNEGQKPKTINVQLHFVKAIFSLAIEEGYLVESPVRTIKRFRNPKEAGKVEYWDKDEVKAILETVKTYWCDPLEFLYHTGLRKGELINLVWDDIDLNSDHPTIAIQSKENWTVKTSQRRIIPLNRRAVEIIQRQTHADNHDYVFKGKEGGQIHRDKIYRGLQTALKKLGLEGNVHKFRHTFASHLVMKAAGIETVSKLLGHSSIEMTMKYAHLAPDHLQKAVQMLVEPDED